MAVGDTLTKIVCDQEGCTIGIDGKCLEGLDEKTCSHCSIETILDEDNEDDKEESVHEINKEEIDYHSIHPGYVLEEKDALAVTRAAITRLIVLIGLHDTGKTTALASLYECFMKNTSYGNYQFSKSLTLIGFEERCYQSRANSGRLTPDTGRTPTGQRNFLHLKVKNIESKDFTDLLFTDISGEDFESSIDSKIECEKLEFINRADHVVLFIDSEKLSNRKERSLIKTKNISLLRGLIDAKVISPNSYIDVVFSKWDLVSEDEDTSKLIEIIKDEILNKFQNDYRRIGFYELASRPTPASAMNDGYGLDILFTQWVEKPFYIDSFFSNTHKSTSPSREFSKYIFLKDE